MFCIHLADEEGAGCYTLIVFLLTCGYLVLFCLFFTALLVRMCLWLPHFPFMLTCLYPFHSQIFP